jgi:fructose/tagatose bisphosphate aldolase
MAISVGNVHLQQDREGGLDEPRIRAIEAVTDVPLVIHGGSGVPVAQRAALAAGLAHLQVQHRHGTADGLRRSAARRRPTPTRTASTGCNPERHP